jgi:hypothetical protein
MNEYTTGLESLDTAIRGLEPGDNVVWRVDDIAAYLPFCRAFVERGLETGKRIVYFRFANHPRVIPDNSEFVTIETHPELSFENFITDVHGAITEYGDSAYYVFDSLSELSENYFSDRMIGNFFKLTCTYLTEKRTLAYFALYRYKHSYHAMDTISETTQIMIDVYRYEGSLYIKPAKLLGKQSHETYRVHEWRDDDFVPVTSSAMIAEVIASTPWTGLPSASYRMVGVWDTMFIRAESTLSAYQKGQSSEERMKTVLRKVLRLIISRDERILNLAEAHLSLEDIIHIWKRMIGTGLIGGKSVGMLIARAILTKQSEKWAHLLEDHDSFFIASDVFYTFLVVNGCWWDRQRQKNPETFLDGNESVRKRILKGNFPEYIINRFSDMLDYYGYSPIIVRSSSLLEDNFGNAFAGKYESVFCANQGSKEERLEYFLNAVRLIYASTMSVEALSYRKNRGVLDRDEQMALLVQRVSGSPYGNYYFPQLAGVGFSFNPYAWNEEIDPEAGMVRLVFGLGTRAVDRADDDYTRVVALNAPEKRPEADFAAVKRYAQRRVDVLDLESNDFRNIHFTDLAPGGGDMPLHLFATRDRELERTAREQGMKRVFPWVLTFDTLMKKTSLVEDMREMFSTVRDAYESEVDIEFTANFLEDGSYRINLVQCRPLQIQEASETVEPLPDIDVDRMILDARGATIGHSRKIRIERLVYVVPELYGKLAEQDRYRVAKLIGKLSSLGMEDSGKIMLIGPGRWGTSTPSLGIPVSFREINNTSVLCEIDSMHEGLVPDLSLGTHFFNELVELNMLYVAYFVGRKGNRINTRFLMDEPNRLSELLEGEDSWADLVKVIDYPRGNGASRGMYLNANALEQRSVLYVE